MSMEAQQRKRQRVDLDPTTPRATSPLPPTPGATCSTPQPGTSQAQERKADEGKASLLTIREELLQTLEANEDTDSDEENVMLTKKRG